MCFVRANVFNIWNIMRAPIIILIWFGADKTAALLFVVCRANAWESFFLSWKRNRKYTVCTHIYIDIINSRLRHYRSPHLTYNMLYSAFLSNFIKIVKTDYVLNDYIYIKKCLRIYVYRFYVICVDKIVA